MDGVVLAALGSEYRRDDGAGPLVARLAAAELGDLGCIGPLADPLDLVGRWDDAELAVVVDAVRSGLAPGTVSVLDLDRASPGAEPPSTHAIGLARALRLGRALGRCPRRVVVVGIEGAEFGDGVGLSPSVAMAVPAAVRAVVGLVRRAACA